MTAAPAAPSDAPSDPFLVLPVRMPPAPAFPVSAIHEMRVRRNTPKTPTETDRRTLFVKNVPADATEPHLRAVVAALVGPGRFEAAFFEDGSRAPVAVDPARVARVKSIARKRKRGTDDDGWEVARSDDDDDQEDDDEAEQRRRAAEAANLPEIWNRAIHRSGSSAVVLLADEKSASLVLKAVAKLARGKKLPVWGEGVVEDDEDANEDTPTAAANNLSAAPPLGAHWIAHHLAASRTRTEASARVRSAVRALFAVVNAREKEAAALARRMRSEPDADGFVTVTRGSGARTAPASRAEAEQTRRKMLDRAARRKDETGDFYRFQRRQRLKREHDLLKSRFQEDQERVRAMREKRGVRPE
jgi:ribosomal RNA-processing protein 7